MLVSTLHRPELDLTLARVRQVHAIGQLFVPRQAERLVLNRDVPSLAYPPAFFIPALMPSRNAVLPSGVSGSSGQIGTSAMFPFTVL